MLRRSESSPMAKLCDSVPTAAGDHTHSPSASPSDNSEAASPDAGRQLVGGGRKASRESQGAAPDASVRSKKRQKSDGSDLAQQIKALEHEVTAVRQELDAPVDGHLVQSRQLALECFEMRRRAEFLHKKLAEHCHWMQRVSSLMETAPLLDLAIAPTKSQSKHSAFGATMDGCPADCRLESHGPALNMQFVDDWRRGSAHEPLSRFILDQRLKVATERSIERASKLLATYDAPSSVSCLFPHKFDWRGWQIATGVMIDTSIAFRCERQLSLPSAHRIGEVTMELWGSVQRDEVFRTFIPVVQDSVLAHEGVDYSLSRRVLQFSSTATAVSATTIEAMRCDDRSTSGAWQISVETVHDNYLCTFAADAVGVGGTSQSNANVSSPPSALDLGFATRKFSMTNDFIIGMRVAASDVGVKLLLVGSVIFDLHDICDPAFELLQYFVTCLPIYEELYLQQYEIP